MTLCDCAWCQEWRKLLQHSQDSIDTAIYMAAIAHSGQKDKAGQPYLLHIIQVASQMESIEESIVAILHDVVEDSAYTLADLKRLFSAPIIEAIDAITRRKGEDYWEYIRRVSQNELARTVKLVDLRHNLDPSRIEHPTHEDRVRAEKYRAALNLLRKV